MLHGKTFGSFLIGLILFIVSFSILFCNELSFVNLLKKVDFAEKNAIELSSNTPISINDGKLVLVSGNLYSNQVLTDGVINVPKSIILERTTEMYQWQEIFTFSDGYKYRKTWDSNLINSDNFKDLKYINPKGFKYEPMKIRAKNVSLGHFHVSNDIINKLNYVTKIQQLPYNNKFKIYNGFYFTGNDFDNAKIGEQKLFYSYIPSGVEVSVLAKQVGDFLEPMSSQNGDIFWVTSGIKNLSQLLNDFKENNSSSTRLGRGIGILLMFIGLNLIIQPIVIASGKVPILGELTQGIAFFITIITTLALASIAISMSWFLLKPEFAAVTIIIAFLVLMSLKRKEKIIIKE